MREDLKLVQRMQRGERRAFEEFVDLYGADVHRLVRRYVSRPADAEDVTQEIFYDLYRSISKFRGEAQLKTWVYRVAVNCCLRHCQRTRPEGQPLEETLADTDWRTDPAQSAAKSELTDRVQHALTGLSELHRDVVVLHELHGLTYMECAEALDVPVGTVKSRLSNAFRRLRESLHDLVQPEPTGVIVDNHAIKEGSR